VLFGRWRAIRLPYSSLLGSVVCVGGCVSGLDGFTTVGFGLRWFLALGVGFGLIVVGDECGDWKLWKQGLYDVLLWLRLCCLVHVRWELLVFCLWNFAGFVDCVCCGWEICCAIFGLSLLCVCMFFIYSAGILGQGLLKSAENLHFGLKWKLCLSISMYWVCETDETRELVWVGTAGAWQSFVDGDMFFDLYEWIKKK